MPVRTYTGSKCAEGCTSKDETTNDDYGQDYLGRAVARKGLVLVKYHGQRARASEKATCAADNSTSDAEKDLSHQDASATERGRSETGKDKTAWVQEAAFPLRNGIASTGADRTGPRKKRSHPMLLLLAIVAAIAAYLPAEDLAECEQALQRCRRKANPKKGPREAYTTRTYGDAVKAACERHRIEPWHPHQLRHSAATEIRKRFGLEGARAALGHQTLIVTEEYAERDLTRAARVAAELG
jgi:hypothetical protein